MPIGAINPNPASTTAAGSLRFDTGRSLPADWVVMGFTRPVMFWIAMLAAVLAAVVLLREVLLPFVAGMVLAYLLDPLANRIERLGMNRLLATLAIIALVVVTVITLFILIVPVLIKEIAYFVESFPLYVRRLHA